MAFLLTIKVKHSVPVTQIMFLDQLCLRNALIVQKRYPVIKQK